MKTWFEGAAAAHGDFNANKFVNDTIEKRSDTRTKQTDQFNWTGSVTVVGINAQKIPAMIEAINTYVNKVKNHLDGIKPTADANGAYKGEEVQKAVENYVNKVKEYCFNLTSQLRAFNDKLSDIASAYDKNKRKLAENINADTGSYAAGTEYKTGTNANGGTVGR